VPKTPALFRFLHGSISSLPLGCNGIFMRISIFGLGYVGVVSTACLAADGHSVIGVDPTSTKTELMNAGKSPIVEQEVDQLLAAYTANGQIRATHDAQRAVAESELSLVCVGTPSQINGALDLRFVRAVCEEIGAALKLKTEFHTVVIRSTILPGTMRNVVIPTLEAASGKVAGKDFGVCNNPEFLREGTAVYDYRHPPKTVIGSLDARSGERLVKLYEHLDAPLIQTTVEVAEMVKYVDNCWHALKVGFANEIGSLCKALSIDSHRVMEIFCQDLKLNLSPYYLKPGFAFGGSCLPKDLRAINSQSRKLDLSLPILGSILPSNGEHLQRAIDLVLAQGKRKIGILGLSFKAGTDDLRESPAVDLVERLIGKGCEVSIYDRNVEMASLVGANKDYILNQIPHISRLLVSSLSEITSRCEVLVIGNRSPEFEAVLQGHAGKVIDLVRIVDDLPENDQYEGLCW
jgi:GDP-mannose 6-dehydrogenase